MRSRIDRPVDSPAFRKIRLAVAAIDGGAKAMGISGREMFERLDRLGQLRFKKVDHQLCIHSQAVVDQFLRFQSSQEVPYAR